MAGEEKPGFYFSLGGVGEVDERNPVSGGLVLSFPGRAWECLYRGSASRTT